MTVSNGKLVIEMARMPRRKRRYTLDELVAGITPDNRMGKLIGVRPLAMNRARSAE